MADYDYVVINGKKRPVHILIAEQMLGRPLEPDEVVHHINGNKHDNDESNLKIMKRDEHSRLHHTAARHGKETRDKIAASSKGRPGPNRCFNREQVREIADRLQSGERMADLAKKYGVDKNVIRNICIGKSYRDCLPELTDEAFPLQQPRKSRISSQRKIPIPELGEIRVELMAGEALSEIAERHHLAAATIMNIRDGETYKDIPWPEEIDRFHLTGDLRKLAAILLENPMSEETDEHTALRRDYHLAPNLPAILMLRMVRRAVNGDGELGLLLLLLAGYDDLAEKILMEESVLLSTLFQTGKNKTHGVIP